VYTTGTLPPREPSPSSSADPSAAASPLPSPTTATAALASASVSTTPTETVPLASGAPASGSNTTTGSGSALSGGSVSAGDSGGTVLGSDQAAWASKQAPPARAVVGAVAGGLVVGAALAVGGWVLMLRRKKAGLRRHGPLSGTSNGACSDGLGRSTSGVVSARASRVATVNPLLVRAAAPGPPAATITTLQLSGGVTAISSCCDGRTALQSGMSQIPPHSGSPLSLLDGLPAFTPLGLQQSRVSVVWAGFLYI